MCCGNVCGAGPGPAGRAEGGNDDLSPMGPPLAWMAGRPEAKGHFLGGGSRILGARVGDRGRWWSKLFLEMANWKIA